MPGLPSTRPLADSRQSAVFSKGNRGGHVVFLMTFCFLRLLFNARRGRIGSLFVCWLSLGMFGEGKQFCGLPSRWQYGKHLNSRIVDSIFFLSCKV